MTSEELKQRSKEFAHRCVRLASSLPIDNLGNYLSRQLIRSSISCAANYNAVCVAQSKKAFTAKISIVLEETDESGFWINFILDEELIDKDRLAPIKQEALELSKIFAASRLTVTGKRKKKTKKQSTNSTTNKKRITNSINFTLNTDYKFI